MDVPPAFFVGNPLGSAVCRRDFAVGGHGVFHCHIRAFGGDVVKEWGIERIAFFPQKILFYRNACLPQQRSTFARYLGIGIPGTNDDLGNACLQNGVGTGRCFAIVAAGFQCDKKRGAFRGSLAVCQRVALCMQSAEAGVISLADDMSIFDENGAYQWVGVDCANPLFRQGDGTAHQILFFQSVHFLSQKKEP